MDIAKFGCLLSQNIAKFRKHFIDEAWALWQNLFNQGEEEFLNAGQSFNR
jgi:hypothetical protein